MKSQLPVVIVAVALSGCGILIEERGSGKGGTVGSDTVTVCHKGKKTMELPRDALQAHLDHGDRRGPC